MLEKLKIATWNCKGAFRKKQKYLLGSYNPDIWVIQECEHPEKFSKEKNFQYPQNHIWYGDNQNRGIAVFAKTGINLKISNDHNPNFKYIIPVIVSGEINLILYAVWAMSAPKENWEQRYIGQVSYAFNNYQMNEQVDKLIIGDYNGNLNFDKKLKGLEGKFQKFLKQMYQANYQSAYHKYYLEDFGKESQATFHLQNKKDKPYHIDYIFGNQKLIDKIDLIKVGVWEDWCSLSDHVPIYAEFKA